MKKYYLLGYPISHSISPAMHNESFRQLGLSCSYELMEVRANELPGVIDRLRREQFGGCNLTMPCKNDVVSLLDELSDAARLIGAVNTVANHDGVLTGYNTDGIGFMRCASDVGFSVKGSHIVLLGAGGAASAIAVQAALDDAASLDVFARDTSRYFTRMGHIADSLNAETACRVALHTQKQDESLRRAISEADLLINGTSVGMAPNTDQSILSDVSYFHNGLLVGDVIYNPRETKFLRLASESGCSTFGGLHMLLYQGAEAFRIWTGQNMPIDIIRDQFFK